MRQIDTRARRAHLERLVHGDEGRLQRRELDEVLHPSLVLLATLPYLLPTPCKTDVVLGLAWFCVPGIQADQVATRREGSHCDDNGGETEGWEWMGIG